MICDIREALPKNNWFYLGKKSQIYGVGGRVGAPVWDFFPNQTGYFLIFIFLGWGGASLKIKGQFFKISHFKLFSNKLGTAESSPGEPNILHIFIYTFFPIFNRDRDF